MVAQASNEQMNKFVSTVDEFMQKYARLIQPSTRAEVMATGNPQLIADYNTAVSRGGLLKANIEAVTGAWAYAKDKYREITKSTSMYIGDAIDEIRSWFGYNPGGINGLGAIQIPAAVWVVGTIAAAGVLISGMNKIFVAVEASKIQRENPGMPRETALEKARSSVGFDLFGGIKLPVMIGLGALLYMVLK